MSFDVETLYGLLPEVYRTRDAAVAEALDDLLTAAERSRLDALRAALARGDGLDAEQQGDLARLEEKRVRGPLKALLTVIGEQVAGLEENIEQLYDDQFIETCAEWVVPYLGDLVGHRPLDPEVQRALGTGRAEVANTIRSRRRKGTAAILEELAIDITGWDAAVVEFFLRLATTQYVNHVRPGHRTTVDLRRVEALERAGSAFDPLAHTADVRRIATRGGRYNIPNVGVFLFRVRSRRLTDAPAFRVDARRFRFDPLGADTQLYNRAERATDVTRLAQPLDVPQPITRRALRRDLPDLYGRGKSLSIQVGTDVLRRGDVEACDLSDTGPDPATSAWAHAGQERVAVDPVLGRIAFPADVEAPVLVTFHYGAAADIGGGEYDRADRPPPPAPVRRVTPARPDVAQALADLGGSGTVEIAASGVFAPPPVLRVAANGRLAMRAAAGARPVVRLAGDLVLDGGDSGEIVLDGVVLSGGRVVVPAVVDGRENRLQKLRLVHCTLVPAATRLEIAAANVAVEVEHCLIGAVRVVEEATVALAHSVVDALGPDGVAYAAPGAGDPAGGPLRVDACTLVGKVHAAELAASHAIFHAVLGPADPWTAPVVVERRQTGYVRGSYVPAAAQVPRRYKCRPEDAADVVPRFASLRHGDPAYAQLHAACPAEIRCGALDGGEMGAFHDAYGPQRLAALGVRIDEYLRFGLEAGLLFGS